MYFEGCDGARSVFGVVMLMVMLGGGLIWSSSAPTIRGDCVQHYCESETGDHGGGGGVLLRLVVVMVVVVLMVAMAFT